MKALRVLDQWGWCYHFISSEHAKHSRHEIVPVRFDVVDFSNVDLVYIHSPNIFTYHIKRICSICNAMGIPIIGAYAGNPMYWKSNVQRLYDYVDLAVGISPETYIFCKENYQCPTVFMPEPVDTDFFVKKTDVGTSDTLRVGWAGGAHKEVKRCHLLRELKYEVKIQSNWGRNVFVESKTQDDMVDFYNSIDVLVLTSQSECQPRVVLEAMACGRAVVSTDVGNVRAMIDSNYVVPVEKSEMVRAMNEKLDMLSDKSLLARVGADNIERVQRMYSWASTVSLWDGVFELVSKRNIPGAVSLAKNFVTVNNLQGIYN